LPLGLPIDDPAHVRTVMLGMGLPPTVVDPLTPGTTPDQMPNSIGS
jgi:hypothetical protein